MSGEAATISMPNADLPPGRMVGPYRIEAKLGEGGMGVVVKAVHTVLNRPVALKIMRPEIAADRQFVDRFLREARAAAAVQHQHLVAIFDAGEVDGRTFLVFEFVPGGDLDALLTRQGTLTPARALEVIAGCADGLQALHEAGLVHRDLKPHNVFLDTRGRPKLGDFGLARDAGGADRLTVTGVGMGTPAYMAPEQAQGDPTLDVRADIHALGGTLFTLLTRRTPFVGATPWAVVNAVVNEAVPDPRSIRPDVPAEVAAIVQRAMAKRREDRFQTPAELRDACRAALARLNGASGASAPMTTTASGSFLGPFAAGGWLWLLGAALLLLLLPLGLNPLCAVNQDWHGPGYGQPGLWGHWLGFTAAAAALLWTPLRLAAGERIDRTGLLATTMTTGVLLCILLWSGWVAILDASEAGPGWRTFASISTSLAGLSWLAWWARRAWDGDAALPGLQLTRATQIAIPLLIAVLTGHLIAAGSTPEETRPLFNFSHDRVLDRHADAEAACALALALPLAVALVPALLRLRLRRR